MNIDHQRALGIALEIGDSLCRSAFKYDGAVTWMGAQRALDEDSETVRTSHVAVGPSLYSGGSGIALFLSEARVRGGDARFEEYAVGAMRHVMSQLDRLERSHRFGFYSGLVGAAYALARVGSLLDQNEFVKRAREIVNGLAVDHNEDYYFDIIGGGSGGAPALLALQQMLGMDACADTARTLGHGIIRAATRSDHGWSWGERSGETGGAPHLVGFGHGAGGIGWSLMELYDALGDEEFLHAAREAFRYETHWYQQDRENWPDLQEYDASEPLPCPVAWCHGAAGIGLSRLKMLHRLGDASTRRDVEAAARTTVRTLQDPDQQDDVSYTLCHGQASLAEFLSYAAGALADPALSSVAADVVWRGAERHGGRPESWASGTGRGTNPSLMLGQAGIGHFYLRIADPRVPSVLLCGAAAPSAALGDQGTGGT